MYSITKIFAKIELKKFSIEQINNNPFLCFDEKDYTFLIGNLGYDANIKIETRGEDHQKQAREFIKTINRQQLK